MTLLTDIPQNWRDALDAWQEAFDEQYETPRERQEALDALGIVRWPDSINNLQTFLDSEVLENDDPAYYPTERAIFKTFWKTPFNRVRVVIVGQDPYPDSNKATGLAFSLRYSPPPNPMPANGIVRLSSSIDKIYDAIAADNRIRNKGPRPTHGDLVRLLWARQGVLLLNRVLTFRKCNRCKVNLHRNHGWEIFTKTVIKALSDDTSRRRHFILWGVDAKKVEYKNPIDRQQHRVYPAAHPVATKSDDPLLRSCGHFSDVNRALGVGNEIPWFPRA